MGVVILQELCARYWPTELSTTEDRGLVSIELLSEATFDDYIHREIKLNESVKVRARLGMLEYPMN